MVVEQTILKLSQHHSPALVDEWEKMDDTPKQINGEWISTYLPRIKNGTPKLSNECSYIVDALNSSSNPGPCDMALG